ncbi:MAG TPA: type II toxin-antitoxin system VapC family toxin [Pirellulaceae bacterium]|jgi:predicted nucleic acid-binding protein
MTTTTVYVETTVIGHLVGRILADPIVAGRQYATRQWWTTIEAKHRPYASQLVADECSAGDPSAAAERLHIVRSIEFLTLTSEAIQLTEQLMAGHAIPSSEPRDAAHVSLAAIHGIQYLVTWNFKHIANPSTRRIIESICLSAGYTPPTICTPDELLEV